MRHNLQALVERDTAINNAADEFVTQFCGGSESVTEMLSAVIYSLFDKYAPAPVPPQPTRPEKLEIAGHAWQATSFSFGGRYGNCECGNAPFVSYSQHQAHLASARAAAPAVEGENDD
jgi:hypothetical protein